MGGAYPERLAANQPGQGEIPISGRARMKEPEGRQSARGATRTQVQSGVLPGLPQQASHHFLDGRVNSSILKMKKLKSERLSNLSEVTQLTGSGAGV